MVSKVTRSQGADSSDTFRRPRFALRPARFEDIGRILCKRDSYPSPVRAVGADYSQTRCVGGDGGTAVDTGALDKILEWNDDSVRAQAGVRLGTLVRALAERGLELPLTPEIGNISVGAAAVTTLPQPSFEPGLAQLSSCVTELKLITPQGKEVIVTEQDRDLMHMLRSSFGLLGIVHEAVLRVRPLTPVRIDYELMSLEEFRARYSSIVNEACALRLHLAPFNDRVMIERRNRVDDAGAGHSSIWQIRNSVMRNVLPAFGSSVSSVLAATGLRYAVLAGVQRALCATLDGGARSVVMHAHEWMRELPEAAWKARQTHSLWAFPQSDFPAVVGEYFAFCKSYDKQHGYKCNVVASASRLHQDSGSLFSPSYLGPAITLEPSSGGEKGWDDFLIDFNEFASTLGGTPTFNQTRALQPEHIARAFPERVKLFRALRRRTDPSNRLRNSYFAYLLV